MADVTQLRRLVAYNQFGLLEFYLSQYPDS
jgi:hypothetical protein